MITVLLVRVARKHGELKKIAQHFSRPACLENKAGQVRDWTLPSIYSPGVILCRQGRLARGIIGTTGIARFPSRARNQKCARRLALLPRTTPGASSAPIVTALPSPPTFNTEPKYPY